MAQVVIVRDTTNPHEMTPTPDRGGSFHTAFTIMACWVVSMMLLMVYLYFSPRDLRKRWGSRRNSASKRVVFVEPWMEVATLNQQTHLAAARNGSGVVATRSILKNGGSSTSSSVTVSPVKEICPLI